MKTRKEKKKNYKRKNENGFSDFTTASLSLIMWVLKL